ncbi:MULTISPECIES: hypothetical protein [Flavobacterium]|uniref:hypothetical protein n=1 Tax=Flavobacterium TaxID=237 RepID=UPI001183451E|nr:MULTISPECIES: hypothetical protein [Flavobacterium]MCR4030451.1 hypothetical protein [Flavobacterium panacis]
MKLRKHPFFQKNKSFKYFLLVHLVISLIFCVSQLIHGFIKGDPFKSIAKPFENLKALSIPEKYLKTDFFVLDTAFVEQKESSSGASTECSKYTIVKGHVKDSDTQREIIAQDNNLETFYTVKYDLVNNIKTPIYIKKNEPIKIWRSTLNDEIFLENEQMILDEKFNAVIGLYFQVSLILLTIQLLILKKRSEIE